MCGDSPDRLTKPRIGDVFEIEGVWQQDKDYHGKKVKQLKALDVRLVKRGEVSRPGDFADKLFFIDKEGARKERVKKQIFKEAARKESGLKGKSARNKQLAIWLKEKFGPGMKYVDVAGGNGELTRALLDPAFGCAA